MSEVLVPPAFMAEGVCGQADPEVFFPLKGTSPRAAKSVCWGCPVRMECLEWALGTRQRWGVWGGLSERERRMILRGRDAA